MAWCQAVAPSLSDLLLYVFTQFTYVLALWKIPKYIKTLYRYRAKFVHIDHLLIMSLNPKINHFISTKIRPFWLLLAKCLVYLIAELFQG